MNYPRINMNTQTTSNIKAGTVIATVAVAGAVLFFFMPSLLEAIRRRTDVFGRAPQLRRDGDELEAYDMDNVNEGVLGDDNYGAI